MNTTIQETSFTIGRYRVSPLTRDTGDTNYQAAVSIRSGTGRASCDRVFTFTPIFNSRQSARRYAAREGAQWALRAARV